MPVCWCHEQPVVPQARTVPSFISERLRAAASSFSIWEMYMFKTGPLLLAGDGTDPGSGVWVPLWASPLWKYSHWWCLNASLTWTRCHPRGFASPLRPRRQMWLRGENEAASENVQKGVKRHHQKPSVCSQRGHVICVFILPHPL